VNFPIERDAASAWPDFTGWRVNYERAAYAIADAVDAVPAMWSGPRRQGIPPIPPLRPAPGRAMDRHHPLPGPAVENLRGAGQARSKPDQPGLLSTANHR
jgi:hypothetical protein